MRSRATTEVGKRAVTSQEAREELEFLLRSKEFATSKRQSALLKYLCEKCMDGEGLGLKEYTIALEVFNRNPEYSAAEDSIVRVSAHELRRRLNEYYLEEGKDRPLRIVLPKGSYCPEFIRAEDPPASIPAPGRLPQGTEVARRTSGLLLRIVLAIILASLGLNVWLVISSRKLPKGSSGVGTQPEGHGIYGPLFGNTGSTRRRILICLSNPLVFLAENWTHPPPSSYLVHQTLSVDSNMERILARMNPKLFGAPLNLYLHPTIDEYTGMGEAACAFRLGRLMERLDLPVELTQARFLNWDRATQDNLIVLGLPHYNWTSQNISSSFFRTTDDGLQLLNPRPNEQADFPTIYDAHTGKIVIDYGVIDKETLSSGAWVLTLGGVSSFGTYGVGEFFCDPDKMTAVIEKLRSLNGKRVVPTDFVVFVKIKVSGDLPMKVSYVTSRIASSGVRGKKNKESHAYPVISVNPKQ